MPNYSKAARKIKSLVGRVQKDDFPALKNEAILTLLNHNKRTRNGFVTLASIRKASPVESLLTESATLPGGVDLVMILDYAVSSDAEEGDLVRLIRHEFQHLDRNPETGTLRMRGHEVTDFHDEMWRNKEDPCWKNRLMAVWRGVHDDDNAETAGPPHPELFPDFSPTGNEAEESNVVQLHPKGGAA